LVALEVLHEPDIRLVRTAQTAGPNGDDAEITRENRHVCVATVLMLDTA
jgi:hypothetical protein